MLAFQNKINFVLVWDEVDNSRIVFKMKLFCVYMNHIMQNTKNTTISVGNFSNNDKSELYSFHYAPYSQQKFWSSCMGFNTPLLRKSWSVDFGTSVFLASFVTVFLLFICRALTIGWSFSISILCFVPFSRFYSLTHLHKQLLLARFLFQDAKFLILFFQTMHTDLLSLLSSLW